LQGLLLWSKPDGVVGPFYPAGFTNEVIALGSRYAAPPGRMRVLNLSNGVVRLQGGNLLAPATNEFVLEPRTRLTIASPNPDRLALTLSAKTGQTRGSFVNPQTRRRSAIRGVLLDKQNSGAGYFLGTNRSGSVYFGRL